MNFPGIKNGQVCPKCALFWIVVVLLAIWVWHRMR